MPRSHNLVRQHMPQKIAQAWNGSFFFFGRKKRSRVSKERTVRFSIAQTLFAADSKLVPERVSEFKTDEVRFKRTHFVRCKSLPRRHYFLIASAIILLEISTKCIRGVARTLHNARDIIASLSFCKVP